MYIPGSKEYESVIVNCISTLIIFNAQFLSKEYESNLKVYIPRARNTSQLLVIICSLARKVYIPGSKEFESVIVNDPK